MCGKDVFGGKKGQLQVGGQLQALSCWGLQQPMLYFYSNSAAWGLITAVRMQSICRYVYDFVAR